MCEEKSVSFLNKNKKNSQYLHVFQVRETLSRYDVSKMASSPGDILEKYCRAIDSTLRTLSLLPPQSVNVIWRYIYHPLSQISPVWDRLRIYLIIASQQEKTAKSLADFIEQGPFAEYYSFQKTAEIEDIILDPLKLSWISEIIRREDAVPPLYSKEHNALIPDFYYLIHPFEPNRENDQLSLDAILSELDESAVIDLAVQPCDPLPEIQKITQYSNRLKQISSTYLSSVSEDNPIWPDFSEETSLWSRSRPNALQPHRRRDPLAEEIYRKIHKFQENIWNPLLLFQVRVGSSTAAVTQLVAAEIANSSFQSGHYRILTYSQEDPAFAESWQAWKNYDISLAARYPQVWNHPGAKAYTALQRLSRMASVEEIAGFFRPPLAGNSSMYTMRISTDPPVYDDSLKTLVLGVDCGAGNKARKHAKRFDMESWLTDKKPSVRKVKILLDLLTKHMFITALPGKGKTNTLQTHIIQLYLLKIPFLLIESAKTEYRIFKTLQNHPDERIRQLAREIRIYTAGSEISPFRFNPLWYPPGASRDEHITYFLQCCQGAMPMFAAFPSILQEALERIYRKHRKTSAWPTLDELVEEIHRVLENRGYSHETFSDLSGAAQGRLQQLIRGIVGKIFLTRECFPDISELMQHPTILEIDYMSDESKSLLILFLLSTICQYIKKTRRSGQGLRHVIILEEAHTILGKQSESSVSEIAPDPTAHTTHLICNMMAIFRALGEGLIIADQLPSVIAPEIVRYTATKEVGGLISDEDCKQMGSAMLFGNLEFEEIPRFLPGEAYVISEGFYRPCRIQTLDMRTTLSYGKYADKTEILEYIRPDDWYRDLQRQRRTAELDRLRGKMDDFENAIQSAVQKCRLLADRSQVVKSLKNPTQRHNRCSHFITTAQNVLNELEKKYQVFSEESYEELLFPGDSDPIGKEELTPLHQHLIHRFQNRCQPAMEHWRQKINQFIDEWENPS